MRLVPRYPWTLLLAVGMASLAWYGTALQRRERVSEKQMDTSVTLVNVPADMVVTSEVPASLSLRVRGPLSRLRTFDPAQTGVVIDLRGASEGDNELAVEPGDVQAPQGVEVLAVSPSQVPLRLERVVQRRLPIRPRIGGQPAVGWAVGTAWTSPAVALVSGPRFQIEALKAVVTDVVTVDGAEGRLEVSAAVRSPHPLVRILEPPSTRVIVTLVRAGDESRGGRRP